MEQLSNTMRNRLAAQQNAASHPDADLLTAYAENTLVSRERDRIMDHLARCRPCRDLLVLAAPDTAIPVASSKEVADRRWLARPAWRWVAAAAAVVIVGAAVTLNLEHRAGTRMIAERSEKTAQSQQSPAPPSVPEQEASGVRSNAAEVTTLAQNQAASAVPRPAPSSTTSERVSKKDIPANAVRRTEPAATREYAFDLRRDLRKDAMATKGKGQAPFQNAVTLPATVAASQDGLVTTKQKEVAVLNSPKPAVSGALQGPTRPLLDPSRIKASESNVTLAQAPPRLSVPPPPPAAQNEAVAVTSSSPAVAPLTAAGPVAQLPPSNAEEKEKLAKRPAIDPNIGSAMKTVVVGGMVADTAAYAPAPLCSIIADGLRCVQGKHSTELHQPDARLKTIAYQGSVIWAGGDALLRSDDAGVTWKNVQKPSSEAISQIVVAADSVYIRTASGIMWKSSDLGASWVQTAAVK